MEWILIPTNWWNITIDWAIISSLAAVAGVGMAAFTFRRASARMEETEQIRIVHDIRNDLFQAEDIILKLKTLPNRDDDYIKSRAVQYLNICEWYSLLVNKNRIKIQDLIDYFKPKMRDHYNNNCFDANADNNIECRCRRPKA